MAFEATFPEICVKHNSIQKVLLKFECFTFERSVFLNIFEIWNDFHWGIFVVRRLP